MGWFFSMVAKEFFISFLLWARSLARSFRSERNNHLCFIFVSYHRTITKEISVFSFFGKQCSLKLALCVFKALALNMSFFFLQLHLQHMEVSAPWVELKLQLGPMPQPQQHWIWTASVTYAAAHGNAGSLTHWARDQTCILTESIQVLNPLSHNGNSLSMSFKIIFFSPNKCLCLCLVRGLLL